MKKLVLLLATLIGAAAAQAQTTQTTDPFYLGVAVGQSHTNVDCSGIASCNNNDTGVKLTGGYQLGNGFSVELGYINFGKFVARLDGASSTLRSHAWTLGGAYALPLSADVGMNFRLGVAQVKTTGEFMAGPLRVTGSGNKAKPYAGLGLTYALNKTTKLELGLDSTRAEIDGEKGNLRLISLGATFAF